MGISRLSFLVGLFLVAFSKMSWANICYENVSVTDPWASMTNDSWTTSCLSVERDIYDPYNPRNAYAKFYTFTLTEDRDIRIDIGSGSRDYSRRAYLRSGQSFSGDALIETYDGVIKRRLEAGTYTLELSHYYLRSYSYRIAYNDVGISNECSLAIQPGVVFKDGWIPQCQSTSRDMVDPYNTIPDEGHRARYLTFTLAQDSDIKIDVDSDVATHMYLLEGSGEHAIPTVYDSSNTEYFVPSLSAGNYTIELTTKERYAPGQFEASLSVFSGSSECVQDLELGNSVSGTWVAACEIRSWLDENGDPYQGAGPERAKYFAFTLHEPTDVRFTRAGGDAKTVMSIYAAGSYLEKLATTQSYYWGSPKSTMTVRLPAGSYHLEVTKNVAEPAIGAFNITSEKLSTSECSNTISLGQSSDALISSGCLSQFRVIDGIDDPYGAQPGIYYGKRFEFTLDELTKVNLGAGFSSTQGYIYLAKLIDGQVVEIGESRSEYSWQTTTNPSITRELDAGTYVFEATTYYPERTSAINAYLYKANSAECTFSLPLNTQRTAYLGANSSINTCKSSFKDGVYNYDPYGPNNGWQYFYANRFTFEVMNADVYQIKGIGNAESLDIHLLKGGDQYGEIIRNESFYGKETSFDQYLTPGVYTVEVTTKYVGRKDYYSILVWDKESEISSMASEACSEMMDLSQSIDTRTDTWEYGCELEGYFNPYNYPLRAYEFSLVDEKSIVGYIESSVSHHLTLQEWNGYTWNTLSSDYGSSYYGSHITRQLDAGLYRWVVRSETFQAGYSFDFTVAIDSDGDGVHDGIDPFPNNSQEWLDTDGDGIGNNADMDDDNDGVYDHLDAFPLDSEYHLDSDLDGLADELDDRPYYLRGNISFKAINVVAQENQESVHIEFSRSDFLNYYYYSDANIFFYTQDGSAIANIDYKPVSGMAQFNQQENSYTVEVPLINDAVYRGQRTFKVKLVLGSYSMNASGGFEAEVQIQDDEAVPAGGVVSFAPMEPLTESELQSSIILQRSENSLGRLEVYVQSRDLSAIAFNDYDPVSELVVFEEGETEKSIPLGAVDNAMFEGEEAFLLEASLISGDAFIQTKSMEQRIQDNDQPPEGGAISFILDRMQVPEGGVQRAGSHYREPELSIGLQRIGEALKPATIRWMTEEGSALENVDYEQDGGLLEFAEGQTHGAISVALRSSYAFQAVEKEFCVKLELVEGDAVLESDRMCIQLLEQSLPPADGVVAFSGQRYSVVEGEQSLVTLNRILYRETRPITANVYSQDEDSAQVGSDYNRVANTIEFADGETSKTFMVDSLEDGLFEGEERFALVMSGDNASAGSQVAIIDNDMSPQGAFRFSGANYVASESDGSVSIIIQRVLGSTGKAKVMVVSKDQTAIKGVNYEAVSEMVEFDTGEVTKTIEIPLLDNGVENGELTFLVALESEFDVTIVTPKIATIRIKEGAKRDSDDDDEGFMGLGMMSYWLFMLLAVLSCRSFYRK